MEKIFFEGFFLQASLIFALGAQNIFILESGLKRQRHLLASFICFVCDLSLILIGVIGAAALFSQMTFLKVIIGLIGVYFLFTYGWQKLSTKETNETLEQDSVIGSSLKKCVLLSITFSILNPHAYLDAFVLIGGMSTKYHLLEERMTFGLGAAIYSGVWFVLLSTCAAFFKPILLHPVRMKAMMSVTGVFLIFLSGKLALDVGHWIVEATGTLYSIQRIVPYSMTAGTYFTSITY